MAKNPSNPRKTSNVSTKLSSAPKARTPMGAVKPINVNQRVRAATPEEVAASSAPPVAPQVAKAPTVYTFTFAGGPRSFTVSSLISPAVIMFVRDNAELLRTREDESLDAYGNRVFNLFRDASAVNNIMRFSLTGDHTGIDWAYGHEDFKKMIQAFVECMHGMLPRITPDMIR